MNATWSCLFVATLALAACVAPGPSGGASPGDVPQYPGKSRFHLFPEEPTLTPGRDLTMEASFTNEDAYTFWHPEDDCDDGVIRVGIQPLWFDTARPGEPPMPGVPKVCGGGYAWPSGDYPPGTSASYALTWDGSFLLWDHSSVERGEGFHQKRFWAAAGDWPISFGFKSRVSWPVEGNATLHVLENDLNRDSRLVPGTCKSTQEAGATLTALDLSVSSRRGRIGTPVTIFLNYTVTLPAAGCYIGNGSPQVWIEGEADFRHSCCGYFPDHCRQPGMFVLTSDETVVRAYQKWEWDGRVDQCGVDSNRFVSPGNTTIRFTADGSGFLYGLPGHYPPEGVIVEWLPT